MNVGIVTQRQFALHGQSHIRHHDLGHQQSAGRGHEAGGEEIVDLDPHGCVSGEDRAGNACHAAGHHREQLRRSEARQIGADDERAFALPHEDIGGGAQAFHLRHAGHRLDRAADPADDELHDPQIIEDRHEAGEEDDDGQRSDGEAGPADFGTGKRAEDEIGARLRIAKKIGHPLRHARNDRAPGRNIENHQGDARLQQEGRADDAEPDGATVGRQGNGDGKDEQDARKTDKKMHERLSREGCCARLYERSAGMASLS